MCIGAPVRVIEPRGLTALCRGRYGEEEVNMMLTGPQEAGVWVLNFLGSAREVMSAEDAAMMDKALDGLAAIMSGEEDIDMDQYFPDLVSAKTG